jgi:nitric oxide dioxygenase
MPLTVAQQKIIKASIPFLEEHGVELTASFYQYMLETYPEVRPFFNKSHQVTKKQPKILAFSLVAYAKNIEDITPLTPFVRQIVEKHVGLSVAPEHYNIVGVCLLKTLKGMLGDAGTPEFMKAWEVAYFDLANALIGLEKDRYAEELKIEDAWLGFKPAKVAKIVDEAENVKSIYIEAEDAKYAKFYPGQYVTIRISTDGGETIQSREYSLSNEYPELDKGLAYYRISVRKIPGGVVSNYIHDKLKVDEKISISAPYGKLLEPYFKALTEQSTPIINKPATFFIGGIGITPSISSIEYFLHKGNPVNLLLSNASLNVRAFDSWVKRLLSLYKDTFTVTEFISELNSTESLPTSENYTVHNRRITPDDINAVIPESASNQNYYLIGPNEYMKLVSGALIANGVPTIEINSEQYGPVEV